MSGLLAILWVIYLGAEDPAGLIATLVIGITDGAMFALVALGYTMVYGIIELINFAHGDVFTLGGFLGLPLLGLFGITSGTKFAWVYVPILVFVFVLVMGLNGLVNITIERVAYRPLRNAPRLAPLITAIGMSFILEGIIGGVLAAVFSGGVVFAGYHVFVQAAQRSLLSLPFDGSYTVTLLILLVVGGVCVGALGSYMGVRRFLSV